MGKTAIAGVIIALILGFGLGMFYIFYLTDDGSSQSTEPRITLTEMAFSYPSGPVPLVCIGPPYNEPFPVTISFTLVNSGEVDALATVEMVARAEVVDSNRYFIRANTSEARSLSEILECNIQENEVSVSVVSIEAA